MTTKHGVVCFVVALVLATVFLSYSAQAEERWYATGNECVDAYKHGGVLHSYIPKPREYKGWQEDKRFVFPLPKELEGCYLMSPLPGVNQGFVLRLEGDPTVFGPGAIPLRDPRCGNALVYWVLFKDLPKPATTSTAVIPSSGVVVNVTNINNNENYNDTASPAPAAYYGGNGDSYQQEAGQNSQYGSSPVKLFFSGMFGGGGGGGHRGGGGRGGHNYSWGGGNRGGGHGGGGRSSGGSGGVNTGGHH